MRRINVVGNSSAGKSTLARELARRLGLRHVELDELFWGSDWKPVADATFRERVSAALEGDAWVADGGYSMVRDIIWRRAEAVVWLDYSMPLVLARWAVRTAQRIHQRTEIWPGTGNRESLVRAVRPDGLLWLIVTGHRKKRRRMERYLAARPDLEVVRLRSPREAELWVRTL